MIKTNISRSEIESFDEIGVIKSRRFFLITPSVPHERRSLLRTEGLVDGDIVDWGEGGSASSYRKSNVGDITDAGCSIVDRAVMDPATILITLKSGRKRALKFASIRDYEKAICDLRFNEYKNAFFSVQVSSIEEVAV